MAKVLECEYKEGEVGGKGTEVVAMIRFIGDAEVGRVRKEVETEGGEGEIWRL